MNNTSNTLILEKNAWDTSVKVEENGYYWNGDPIFQKSKEITVNKPLVIELFCGCKLYSGNSTNYTRMTLRQNCIYCQLQHTKLREYMESGEK